MSLDVGAVAQWRALVGKARQGKARQGKANLIRKMLCRPELPAPALQAAAAAAGCVRHDESPPARAAPSLSPGACAGRAGTHTGQHGHNFSSVQAGQWRQTEARPLPEAAPAARGGLSGEETEQRASGGASVERAGRAGRAQEPAPPQDLSPRTCAGRRGAERGAVESWWSAHHSGSPARCVHAGSARFLVCAASRRHARASLTLAACGSQRSQSSLVLDETPAMPAARTTHHRAQPRLLGPLRALSAHS